MYFLIVYATISTGLQNISNDYESLLLLKLVKQSVLPLAKQKKVLIDNFRKRPPNTSIYLLNNLH
jgi:hypothetical protein